eukprot:819239-Alexandrium_andersonii.AAC.1
MCEDTGIGADRQTQTQSNTSVLVHSTGSPMYMATDTDADLCQCTRTWPRGCQHMHNSRKSVHRREDEL